MGLTFTKEKFLKKCKNGKHYTSENGHKLLLRKITKKNGETFASFYVIEAEHKGEKYNFTPYFYEETGDATITSYAVYRKTGEDTYLFSTVKSDYLHAGKLLCLSEEVRERGNKTREEVALKENKKLSDILSGDTVHLDNLEKKSSFNSEKYHYQLLNSE